MFDQPDIQLVYVDRQHSTSTAGSHETVTERMPVYSRPRELHMPCRKNDLQGNEQLLQLVFALISSKYWFSLLQQQVGGPQLEFAAKVDCSNLGLLEMPPTLPLMTLTLNVSNNNVGFTLRRKD